MPVSGNIRGAHGKTQRSQGQLTKSKRGGDLSEDLHLIAGIFS